MIFSGRNKIIASVSALKKSRNLLPSSSFICILTILEGKRRNLAADMLLFYEPTLLRRKAKSALKPQSDERAGEIHGYTVAEQRYPWAKVPQAHLHLFGLIAKVNTLT